MNNIGTIGQFTSSNSVRGPQEISSIKPTSWLAGGRPTPPTVRPDQKGGADNNVSLNDGVNTSNRVKRSGEADSAYVPINYWASANDASTALQTDRLTSCSALVVLTGKQADGIYANRTMVHLNGSSLNNRLNNGIDGYELVKNLTNEVNEAGGGKVIWASGPDNGEFGMLTALGQQGKGTKDYPLAQLVLNPNVTTDIVNTNAITVAPDGSYTVGDAGSGTKYATSVLDLLRAEMAAEDVVIPPARLSSSEPAAGASDATPGAADDAVAIGDAGTAARAAGTVEQGAQELGTLGQWEESLQFFRMFDV